MDIVLCSLQNKELILSLRLQHPKHYVKLVKLKHQVLWRDALCYNQMMLKDTDTFSAPHILYNWIFNIQAIPLCPIKQVPLKFYDRLFQYRKFSGRGIFTEEFASSRVKTRTRFPGFKERFKAKKEEYSWDDEYKEIAKKTITTLLHEKNDNIGGVCAAIKTTKNAKLYFFLTETYFDANTLTECIFRLINDIDKIPLCQYTQRPLKFINFNKGYKSYDVTAVIEHKASRKKERIASGILLSKEETRKKLNEILESCKEAGISARNLKQTALSHDPSVVYSVYEHTKALSTLTTRWAERAYTLLHDYDPSEKRQRFISFEDGYCDTFTSVNSSRGENELADWLQSVCLDREISRHERILNGMEIDILIENKIGFEYHGEYFHNFEFKGKDYHKQKADLALLNNVKLIQVFETEWYNKNDIVKSILLSKLGIIQQKIYARECSVQVLDTSIKNSFLQENHIQGQDRASVNLGLIHKGNLVACMTFGRGYMEKTNSTELVRFCNKLNTIVVGGASKLLQSYIKTYKPSSIFTYADRRYSNDSSFYEQLGFARTGQTVPNYFYFKPALPQYMKLQHRYNFAKHNLSKKLEFFDSTQTEYQNMKNNGYFKIYDAGSYKYNLELN